MGPQNPTKHTKINWKITKVASPYKKNLKTLGRKKITIISVPE